MLLLAVLQPTRITLKSNGGTKRFWKPSISEAQETIVVVIKTVSDFYRVTENQRQKYASYKLNIQPLMVCIGEDLATIKEFYVVYDNIKYKLPNFLKAFDVLFKLFHVFNFECPLASNVAWTFIQKHLYRISTPYDRVNSNLKNLLEHFKH